jgi:hypothetical protein
MGSDRVHTTDEIEAAGERLLAWAKGLGGVLVIAATLGKDPEDPFGASRPEAVIAGAVGKLNEAEVALLLAQLEVAVLMVLSQMAPGAEMGEDGFRAIVAKARRAMLGAEGLDLCDECGG